MAHPIETRIALRAALSSNPIARRTGEGSTAPLEQAAPELTAIPSRSSAISSVSGRHIVRAEAACVAQSLGAGGMDDQRRRDHAQLSFHKVAHRRKSPTPGEVVQGGARSRAETGDRRDIFRPGAPPPSCPPPLSNGVKTRPGLR